jgi:hypothetical protein
LGEASEDGGVEAVGLGDLAGRLGEVPYLARVDDDDPKLRLSQGNDDGSLQSSGRFEDDPGGIERRQSGDDLADARLVMGGAKALAARTEGDVEMGFGSIDDDMMRRRHERHRTAFAARQGSDLAIRA